MIIIPGAIKPAQNIGRNLAQFVLKVLELRDLKIKINNIFQLKLQVNATAAITAAYITVSIIRMIFANVW